jgi:hypothetical protein
MRRVGKGTRGRLGRDGLEPGLHLGERLQGKKKARKMESMNYGLYRRRRS